MSQVSSEPDEKPDRVRVLIVDGACLPVAALERLRLAGVDVVATDFLVEGQSDGLRMPAEALAIDFVEPMVPPVPFHRQGKDYDNVFRRPRGRPRR